MKKILIIENDNDMRDTEKSFIELHGYEVLGADNAKDGVDLAVKERPDLVLMDIRLPYKKRGIGAAKILRKKKETSNIPIIFLSAYPVSEYEEELKKITNCEYMSKPFDGDALIEKIDKYLK